MLETSQLLHQPRTLTTFQLSEEIHDAAVVVPRSILLSIFLNGILGFAMLVAVLFCLGDIDAALGTSTGYPFIEIFQQAVESTAGAAIMTAIIIILAICATVGLMASASRMLWSFSRDKALPGWSVLQKVRIILHSPDFSYGSFASSLHKPY